jgi:hypothetical protein
MKPAARASGNPHGKLLSPLLNSHLVHPRLLHYNLTNWLIKANASCP